MATVGQQRATLDDLMRTEGKAELIGGRIVTFMASGRAPSRAGFRIAMALDAHAEEAGGEGYPDGIGYAVRGLASDRESFSPDASYYAGPLPTNPMKFISGAPSFAVEVRSEGDYGPAAEYEMRAKRGDYFEAGTVVVWDVDCRTQTVRSYRADAPDDPIEFHPGDQAHAEPALIGWRIAVDRIFA